MKYILLFLVVFFPITSNAQIDIPYTIATIAHEYGVEPGLALYISYKESKWQNKAVGDGHLTCKRTGKPMRSRGIWQYNDCYHNMTDKDAFDIIKSTHKAMQDLRDGKCSQWSVCPLTSM